VVDLGEAFEGFGSDSQGGGVGIGEIRVLLFEVLEFAEKAVVVCVGDFRLCLGVVEVVVVVDELPEFRDALFGHGEGGEEVGLGHGMGKLQTSNLKFQGRLV
jgi:hypothetical protein